MNIDEWIPCEQILGAEALRAQSFTDRIKRRREKETFIKQLNFVYVQRCRLVTEELSFIERRKSDFDASASNLLNSEGNQNLLVPPMLLSFSLDGDQALGERLDHPHFDRLFDILEQCTSQEDIQTRKDLQHFVLRILSRVSFTSHENVMTAARIQLLLKVINDSDYEMAHLAVFTVTNVAKTLPKSIVDILESNALECVNKVASRNLGRQMMDRVALLLATVCCTEDLSRLNKVHVAVDTLTILLESRSYSAHHIEQACYAFQYLTYEKELRIDALIGKLSEIIRNCVLPDC